MSETALCRPRLAPYCQGIGLDIGFGGDPITPTSINVDLDLPYAKVGNGTQHMAVFSPGEVRSFFLENCLDFIYSSHLLEDFTYTLCAYYIKQWRKLLKPGGLLVIYCPDQARYAAHCEATGQPQNPHHIEADFSLETFKTNVLTPTGPWEVIHENPAVETYSWELVARKPKA